MRGRANDPNVQRAKSSRHARRAHYCSCGKIVRGNGGAASHRAMHDRKGDGYDRATRTGHGWLTMDQHRAKFPEQWLPAAKGGA